MPYYNYMERLTVPDTPILEDEEFYRGDDVQRRYEMLRAWRTTSLTQQQAAEEFGESVHNFKRLWKRFKEEGMVGLFDRKPGPKSRRDATERRRDRIVELKEEGMTIYDIADTLSEEGASISYGTVNRVLTEEGYSKKTRGQ